MSAPNTIEFSHVAGTWEWRNGDGLLEAQNASLLGGEIRAVVSVSRAGTLVHRSNLKLTSDRERERFLRIVEEAGGTLPSGVLLALDQEIRDTGIPVSEDSESLQGHKVDLHDPEPWPEPVDGAGLLDDLADWISDYVHVTDDANRAVALWALATWFVAVLYFAPVLQLHSATKRSGSDT